MPIFQRPGSNALETASAIRATMAELEKDFPDDLEYKIIYDPTQFIQQSIDEVQITLLQAILFVVLVIVIFLQSWRAAIIPFLAIPISLIGTFAAMSEVTGAVIATSLVMVAIFVPTAYIPGISGQFYQQFALTISGAVVISTIVSLSLSPALGAILLRPSNAPQDRFTRIYMFLFG